MTFTNLVDFLTTRTGAASGYHGDVMGPRLFYVEPGIRERVDIGAGSGGQAVNIQPLPLNVNFGGAMEKYLIKFIPQASKNGWITVHPSAVRQ